MLSLMYVWHIMAWRPKSSNIQAGGRGPLMPERSGTSVPRRSLSPTVQPETSPVRWAKSTARTTSPTQHVGPLLVRLPGTVFWILSGVRNPNSTEAALRSLLETVLFAQYKHTKCIRGSACWHAIHTDTLTLQVLVMSTRQLRLFGREGLKGTFSIIRLWFGWKVKQL